MSYIHIVCTCSCALFICACLISAHMYLAYVHIRARHRGKKFARAGRIEKCIVQFADTCIYVCVDVSAVFSNSPRRISGFNLHIVFVASIFESAFTNLSWVTMLEGARLSLFTCCYPHLPKFISSKRVAATHQTFISHLGHPSSIYPGSQPFHSRDLKGSPRESSNMTLVIKIPPVSCPMFYLAKYQPLIEEPSQPCFMTSESCSSVHHETITTLPGSLVFQHSLKRQPALSWRWQVSWRSWGNWSWVGVSNHPRTKK